jgi:hypothetical protein
MSIREPSIAPSQATVRTAARPLAPSREPSVSASSACPAHCVQVICTSDELSGIGWEGSTIRRVDNSLWRSDRLTMAIAPAVPRGSFDALPVAGPRRGIGERDGLGSRQTT